MATPVETPKLGNTVEECLVAKWRKRKGERVSEGEVVAEIETDKASFEITAPVSGVLLETFFAEGSLAPVFQNLFVLGEPGEDVEAFRPAAAGAALTEGSTQTASQAPAEARRAEPGHATDRPPGRLSPRARRFAAQRDFDPGQVTGSGPGGRVLEADVREAYFSSPRISPAARRQAGNGAAALAEGSGIGGMILSADLGTAPTRLSAIREKIARRMRESLANTAQYTLDTSADASGLLRLRAAVKASQSAPDVGINEMVTFCVVKALLEVPDMNALFVDGAIRRSPEVHMGFACDTPRGLLVPVVRNAHELSVRELAADMKNLVAKAVSGAISPDDLAGATFTISNLGSLGIESFTPLLNPPQVAILGVNSIQLKPVRRNGAVEFIDAIGFSLTCDHQVIDGAPGARFLQVLKDKVAKVESICTI